MNQKLALQLSAKLIRALMPAIVAVCGVSFVRAEAVPAPPRAAVFSDGLLGFDQALARNMATQAQAAGYATTLINISVLTNQSLLSPTQYELLVLPGARSLPMQSAPSIEHYLQGGGDLLALGLPAWSSPLFQAKGKWLSRLQYDKALTAQTAQHVVENFEHADLSRWVRSTGDATGKASYELVNAPQGKALHASVAHLGGWETLGVPALTNPFPTGHTLTCFRAKGAARTRQLAVEWREAAGSRWIATVDLTTEWKSYVLPPEAFKAWPNWPPEQKNKERFHPEHAATFTVGLALSHTALEGDAHEYWFADMGTAPNPFGDEAPPEELDVPVLESLSPSYQCFPIASQVLVRADHEKVPLETWEANRPGTSPYTPSDAQEIWLHREAPQLALFGLNPRPRGVGFNQARAFRWEPLLAAYDAATDDYRGALAALLVNTEGPYRGSVWAAFTPEDAPFYHLPPVTKCIHQVLSRMKRGVFLTEGGTEFFTVFAGQRFKAGARVVNFGRDTVSNLAVTVSLRDAKGALQRTVLESKLALAPGESRALEQDGLARSADEDSVSTDLALGRTRLDALSHPLGVWQPKTKPQFIEARNGGFWLSGKPWKANGVNYMPSSGIGLAHMEFFENWLGRGAYDPEVIERDLRRIKAMNLNAVSVFINHGALSAQHLLDFLRRCDARGLHVNQSLRPGTPMNFQWPLMKELIQFYRLPENDTVFGYDLAWEPSHGGYEQQQQAYSEAWKNWVLKHYGDLPAAEKAWSLPAPADPSATGSQGSGFGVPPMSQLTKDGPWRKLVADYRLFLDDQLHEHYDAARQLVRSIDPHHAVSFRMSCTGDPSYNWDAALPYDFYGLADAVDIWEPEAYGRIGDWERVKGGEFTAAYARLCDPSKPLMWAEMGYSVWDAHRMAPDPQKLLFEGHYYEDFYRMMMESGADGVFFWWYPGGFRCGENSDFGIINPDGTDRPATKVIRTLGARFLKSPKPARPNYPLAVDRDRDARGLFGMYEAAQAGFWKAIAQGRRPGLTWEHKPGEPR